MKYQQQYIRLQRKASKSITNRLNLDLLCVFSALQLEQGYAFRNEVSEDFDEKYVFFLFEKLLLLS